MSTAYDDSFLSPSKVLGDPWLGLTAPGKSFESTKRSGKWCIFRDAKDIDAAWIQVLAMVSTGLLLCAKVSTRQSVLLGGYPQHVICVYTTDFEDEEDVMRVRRVLLDAGFRDTLKYKRDVDTIRGVERFEYIA